MRAKRFLVESLLLVLMLVSCKSPPTISVKISDSLNRLADISIGDSKKSVIDKLGEPSSKGVEKYQATEYEVLEYSGTNGVPLGYISLDSKTSIVAGRTVWISNTQPERDFFILQRHMAPESQFTKVFVTCDKHHVAEVKVDSEKGVFAGIDRDGVFFISWSDPQLTKLRIEQFKARCPERQKR